MKTLKKLTANTFTTSILILSSFLLSFTPVIAQEFSKTYQGKYDVDKGASMVIKNKFGAIKCRAWDENSVSIDVTINVEASSQERANKVFDKISVELSGTRTKVQGITTIDNINNGDFSIDYDIRFPRWITVDLDNQFGDIFLDEVDGQTDINLEYGAMEAVAFNSTLNDITMKFSDAEVDFMKSGDVNIEYGEWNLKGTENLKLYSRFSENSIDKVASLNLDSQYDEISVGDAGQVIVISRFSELDFEKISGDFDFDIEYGEIDVNYISASFKTGKLRNSFAGADLNFDPKVSMTVDAQMEFGEMSYPKANASMNHELLGYTTNIYKGKFGAGTASRLTIISKNSDVNIDFEE